MRKTAYFTLGLLLTSLSSAHAADVLGAAPVVAGPRGNAEASAGATAAGATNSRDSALDPGIPVPPPLQGAAPVVDTSATAATGATGSTSETGASGATASTPTVKGSAGASPATTTTTTTPADQANIRADLFVTNSIRQSWLKNGLSTSARNIKIHTTNGRVTLRGPVKTEAEKARIESLARAAAGAVTVDNQLSVQATTY